MVPWLLTEASAVLWLGQDDNVLQVGYRVRRARSLAVGRRCNRKYVQLAGGPAEGV